MMWRCKPGTAGEDGRLVELHVGLRVVAATLVAGAGFQAAAVATGGWTGALLSALGLLLGVFAVVGWLTNETRALAGKQRLARELCSWAARPALNPPAGFDERVVARLKVERAKAGDHRWTPSRNDPGAKPNVDAMLWPRLVAGPERQPLADQAVGDYNTAIAAVGRGEYERAAVVLRRYDWRHRPLLGG